MQLLTPNNVARSRHWWGEVKRSELHHFPLFFCQLKRNPQMEWNRAEAYMIACQFSYKNVRTICFCMACPSVTPHQLLKEARFRCKGGGETSLPGSRANELVLKESSRAMEMRNDCPASMRATVIKIDQIYKCPAPQITLMLKTSIFKLIVSISTQNCRVYAGQMQWYLFNHPVEWLRRYVVRSINCLLNLFPRKLAITSTGLL